MSELQLAMPPIFANALSVVEKLSEVQFLALLDTLEHLNPTAPRAEAIAAMSGGLKDISTNDLTGVFEFAVSTRSLLDAYETDLTTLSDAVTRATFTAERKTYDSLRAEVLAPRIGRLLANTFVAKRQKATTLSRDFTSILEGSKCYVDIRPVFATNGGTDEIEGAVVVTSLRLDLDNGDPIYLGVSESELEKLRAAVVRAQEKLKTVRELLNTAAVTNLTPQGD